MSNLTTLKLSPDNPCNTTITNDDTQEVLYIVETQHTNRRTVTRIKSSNGETLASSEWRDVQSDMVTFGEGAKPVPLGVWLKKSWVPFKDTVYLLHEGVKYKWKGNGPGLLLELYTSNDKTHPIAKFLKANRTNSLSDSSGSNSGYLVLDSRGVEIRDMVVVSFLLLERSRRARENSTLNRAAGLAVPPSFF